MDRGIPTGIVLVLSVVTLVAFAIASNINAERQYSLQTNLNIASISFFVALMLALVAFTRKS